MTSLPTNEDRTDCWSSIGVWGDRSCSELPPVVHCHNCSVFQAAGRRFLAGPAPEGYLESWTTRLAETDKQEGGEGRGVLIFRLGDEWLALPVVALREVVSLRPVRRIPFQTPLLAGAVNVRGELHLAIYLDRLLGQTYSPDDKSTLSSSDDFGSNRRLIVAGDSNHTWVFPVDEVDRVYRLIPAELKPVPPTLGRATVRLACGVFRNRDRAVGLLDEGRLFEVVRTGLR
jgi:chemotaxis-related protein WspD